MKEWIKNSWKLLISILGVIAIIGTISTGAIKVYSAQEEIKSVKKDIADVKTNQIEAYKSISKNLDQQFNAMRLQILTDQENQLDLTIQNNKAKGKDTNILKKVKDKVTKEKTETLNKILDNSKPNTK